LKAIKRAEGGEGVLPVARKLGISRKLLHDWIGAWKAHGPEGLNRKRGPKPGPRKLKPLQAADEKRSAIASLVNRPCLRAFWFALGAPDPCAPPCMRQRFLPCTAGERHAPAQRVLAPQRGLASIGPVLRP